MKRCNLFSVKKGLIRETAHDFTRACATLTYLTGESLGGPGSVMVALLTLKQDRGLEFESRCRPTQKKFGAHTSPYYPASRLQRCFKGPLPPRKGPCGDGAGRMPSTRVYEKKNWEFHNISPSCPGMALRRPSSGSVLPRCL